MAYVDDGCFWGCIRTRAVFLGCVVASLVCVPPANAASNGFATPGISHTHGLLQLDAPKRLTVRCAYLGSDVNHESRFGTERGIVEDAVIPEIEGALSLRGEWRLDWRLFTPFAAGTHYGTYSRGAFHSVDAHLETINFSPGLAWLGERVALRFGPQVQLMQKAGFSQALFLPGIVGEVGDGCDVGLGFHAGAAVRLGEKAEVSAGVWSEIDHDLHGGRLHVTPWDLVELPLGKTECSITTPTVAAIRLQVDQTHDLQWWASAEFTNWKNSLRDITVGYDLPVLPDTVVRLDAKDTWFFDIGTAWHIQDTPWTLSAGLGYGTCFVSDERRHPSLLGFPFWQIEAGIRHALPNGVEVFADGRLIECGDDNPSQLGGVAFPYGFPWGTFAGSLPGDYDATVWLLEAGISIPLAFHSETGSSVGQ